MLINQRGGSMKDDIMGILIEVEETKYELMHVLAGLGGSDYDQSLVVRLNHIVVDLEKLYKKQADHEGVTL
jgi:hypothetical protein